MITIAFYNLKGGVGKTAATINVAYLAAQNGYKTLVWDLDPQGATSYFFETSPRIKNEFRKIVTAELELSSAVVPTAYENISIIPSDLSARQIDIALDHEKQPKKKIASQLNTVKKEFDLVLLDCPPGISLLHDNVFYAADKIIMPNIPTTLSIRSFEIVNEYFNEHGFDVDKIKCFFNMVDHRKNLHHEVMNTFYKNKIFFKSYIPYLSDVEKMNIRKEPLEVAAPGSYAAQCYRDLWAEIKKYCL
ncbi:MAG: AAA family ATPase [Chitinophagaceae bacterium]|jgi:cellulose biosynthesis protein BcsQ|nr:AAA family ATPase [Chitinophagaceae bacterium]